MKGRRGREWPTSEQHEVITSRPLPWKQHASVSPHTRTHALRHSTTRTHTHTAISQSSSSASVLISLATPPGRDRAKILWLTAAISTAREMGSWWSAWLALSSWVGKKNLHKSYRNWHFWNRWSASFDPYLGWRCRLEPVETEWPRQLSLLEVGQITSLWGREGKIHFPH